MDRLIELEKKTFGVFKNYEARDQPLIPYGPKARKPEPVKAT